MYSSAGELNGGSSTYVWVNANGPTGFSNVCELPSPQSTVSVRLSPALPSTISPARVAVSPSSMGEETVTLLRTGTLFAVPHEPANSDAALFDKLISPVPPDVIAQISLFPLRPEMKMTVPPSGLNEGSESVPWC